MNRLAVMLGGYCAIAAIVVPAFVRPTPRFVWNASASVPVGLYRAQPAHGVRPGDLVAALPPDATARLMAARGYLPLGLPMLKHVGAVSGQRVCRAGARISIDGRPVAEARTLDHARRLLPVWSGCRTLRADEVFLVNPASADSFDGRYFGPVPVRSITLVLTPFWLPGGAGNAPEAAPGRAQSSTRHARKEHPNDQNW